MTSDNKEAILDRFDQLRHELRIFMNGVVSFLGEHPKLTEPGSEIVHSCKSRIKDRSSLSTKIDRKIAEGKSITPENLHESITDLAGVRVMHLFQEHFYNIHCVISDRILSGDWTYGEKPKAYTWDPEVAEFFKGISGIDIVQKPTRYTSVHYLLRPRNDSPICCELQVRTLFEEIWGEVDHKLNYPIPSQNLACKEQLKVLSKIVGAGSRLLARTIHRRLGCDSMSGDEAVGSA